MTQHRLTKGERFELLSKKVQQLEMSNKVLQMIVQQLGQSSNGMGRDLGEMAQRQRELQYRVLALQELSGLDLVDVNKRSEELQIKDFTETSDKEDAEKGYTVTDVVAEDSVVILTTKTVGTEEDGGFLRSKLHVSEIALPDLKKDLLGKKPGDTFEANIKGTTHSVTVLGVRTVPAKPEANKEQANVAAVVTAEQPEATKH